MLRPRWLLGACVLATVSIAAPRAASAQMRIFAEDWEAGADRWRTTDSMPIAIPRDMGVCSSLFQRETTLTGGGRTFTRAGIAVTGGRAYCLTSWVRGSTGTQPFLGINLSNSAGAVGAEHWLIGRAPYNNGYGASVTNAPSDGVWHWVSAPFTVESTATHVVIKDELFSGGSAGTADFDDIQLWEGGCPTTPQGAAHVMCAGDTAVCSVDGRCVQCTTSSQCTGATPVCDTARNRCVGCLADGDCAAPTARCDSARNVCVACRTGADCGGTTPVCSPEGACGACMSDSDCGGMTPACQASGACGECSMSNATRCTGDRPVCVAGACGCARDADCGDARSGRVCDAMTRSCVAGCSPAMGRNGCPDGRFCTSDDPSGARVGQCTMTCNFDGDCVRAMPTRPLCLAGDADMSRCVVCRTAGDCAGRPGGRTTCDPVSNECVECTRDDASRCMRAGRGALCLTDGTCGCATDTDCGDASSGRVCNAAMHVCEPGCRDGGNGCPTGQICTMGRCEMAPVPDAGADVSAADVSDSAVDVSQDVGVDAVAADVVADARVADVAADVVPDVAPTDTAPVAMDAPQDTGTVTTLVQGDGCGCRAAGSSGRDGAAVGLSALVAVLSARRRRRGRAWLDGRDVQMAARLDAVGCARSSTKRGM